MKLGARSELAQPEDVHTLKALPDPGDKDLARGWHVLCKLQE